MNGSMLTDRGNGGAGCQSEARASGMGGNATHHMAKGEGARWFIRRCSGHPTLFVPNGHTSVLPFKPDQTANLSLAARPRRRRDTLTALSGSSALILPRSSAAMDDQWLISSMERKHPMQ